MFAAGTIDGEGWWVMTTTRKWVGGAPADRCSGMSGWDGEAGREREYAAVHA
jgi:hypothetical protein